MVNQELKEYFEYLIGDCETETEIIAAFDDYASEGYSESSTFDTLIFMQCEDEIHFELLCKILESCFCVRFRDEVMAMAEDERKKYMKEFVC